MTRLKFLPTNNRRIILALSFALLLLVTTTLTGSSSLQFMKPAMAAGLTNISILPVNNDVNTRTTYDIFFKTATTGTIKTIEMIFPPSFDLTQATRYVERSGIGSGSLSSSGSTLKYTVNSPESVSAGTTIRLEIAKIIATTAGSFTVNIRTLNTANSQIDGPTNSGSFVIKDITGNDVSPSFMISKKLLDDDVGHSHGYNPNSLTASFFITDSDVDSLTKFIHIITEGTNDAGPTTCEIDRIQGDSGFSFNCGLPPEDGAPLRYIIINLPEQVVTTPSSSSSVSSSPTISSPFGSLGKH